ncbi:MAG TPA: LuxR C-terminal-related transcriptional regulator, partial [Chitinophagaceae bacterium]|nr:LuxR C-terminal-related transcriptional regulator [Chitinophagaceae bacterium]
RYFNPEDAAGYVPKIQELLERNEGEELISFFQQVRTKESPNWTWYASAVKILLRDEEGRPVLTITTAIPIDTRHYLSTKVERMLEESTFLNRHREQFTALTTREKEVLRLMALGLNSSEMAEKLHISETTATTHRRNIKRKLRVHSAYDITRFAQAFDLI